MGEWGLSPGRSLRSSSHFETSCFHVKVSTGVEPRWDIPKRHRCGSFTFWNAVRAGRASKRVHTATHGGTESLLPGLFYIPVLSAKELM